MTASGRTQMPPSALIASSRAVMARDAEEGIGAFIEKREPRWRNS